MVSTKSVQYSMFKSTGVVRCAGLSMYSNYPVSIQGVYAGQPLQRVNSTDDDRRSQEHAIYQYGRKQNQNQT
jgi:hypothetical protein